MTGFGDASEQVDGVHYSVELRSVNNRFFKAAIRIPETLNGMEGALEALLRKRLSRGSITLSVNLHDPRASEVSPINQEVLANYLRHLDAVRTATESAGTTTTIDLGQILMLPGVLQTYDQNQTLEEARPVLDRLTAIACEKLSGMRATEGKSITEDLSKQCEVIDSLLKVIRQRAPEVIESYHQRLRTRIDDLLARAELKVEEKELIHEVAVFAEKADISEEISRMRAHIEQFQQIVGSNNGEPAGRTLDFITQELLREANTISSKSNDTQISRAVVEIKGSIDRIKEQVQNVE